MEQKGRIHSSKFGTEQKTGSIGSREKQRLLQLAICLVLFLAIWTTKGTAQFSTLRSELSGAIHRSVHMETAWSNVMWSLSAGQPLPQKLSLVWTELFSPDEPALLTGTRPGPMCQALHQNRAALDRVLLSSPPEASTPVFNPMEVSAAKAPAAHVEPDVIHMDYSGPPLPDNATMDRYALGLSETVAPVSGKVTSGFGWRDHPIEHVPKFHRGVDLAAATGTPILAFADGIVDYIGESDACGQYLQLRHDNEVTTFYCHCSVISVQKGQHVKAGEKIAESGATGHVTGPHLHFELKRGGILLQPLYYIETEPD